MKKFLIWCYVHGRYALGRIRRSFIAPAHPDVSGLYVNLGSGAQSGPEYVNVDVVAAPHIHYIHDIKILPMFSSGTVDLLYASHVLEHIPRHELPIVLAEWKRVLKPGGILRISVPDFDNLLKIYAASGNDIDAIVAQLLGQEPPFNNHYSVWNADYARKFFLEQGFTEVRLWDPKTAPHYSMYDRAKRTISAGGVTVPISLNFEAIK